MNEDKALLAQIGSPMIPIDKVSAITSTLIGQSITRTAIEPWSVRILFHNAELYIEGDWKLRDLEGQLIDRQQPLADREEFGLWKITSCKVIDTSFIQSPLPTLELVLDNRMVLTILSNDDGYEDWSLVTSKAKIICNGVDLTTFTE